MSLKKWIAVAAVVVTAVLLVLYQNPFLADQNQTPNEKTTQKNNPAGSVITIDSPYVIEYMLPKETAPNGILVSGDGLVWVAGSNSMLFKLDPNSGKILSSYPISEEKADIQLQKSLMVWTIIQDNDGLIWFSQMSENPLWQFNPKTEKFTAFHTSAAPFQLKVDTKTGDIWFTTLTANTVGVIQKTNSPISHTITEFDVGEDTYPSGLDLGQNYLWVTQIQSQKLVKFEMDKNDDGLVTNITKTLEIPNGKQTIFSPTDIIDSGSTLWITEHGTSFLTKYEMGSHLQRFPTSVTIQNGTTLPFWLRQDPDTQGIWFNEHTGNRIAFFDTNNMTMTEYEIPSRPADGYVVYPLNIAVDQNGNKVWFSEWNTDKIGVIDTKALPFGLRAGVDQIEISGKNGTTAIDLEITGSETLRNNANLSLKATSSMDPTSRLLNMTAKFTKENISLSAHKTEKVTLNLQSHNIPAGNHTLGISATDGAATKSIFVNLVIR